MASSADIQALWPPHPVSHAVTVLGLEPGGAAAWTGAHDGALVKWVWRDEALALPFSPLATHLDHGDKGIVAYSLSAALCIVSGPGLPGHPSRGQHPVIVNHEVVVALTPSKTTAPDVLAASLAGGGSVLQPAHSRCSCSWATTCPSLPSPWGCRVRTAGGAQCCWWQVRHAGVGMLLGARYAIGLGEASHAPCAACRRPDGVAHSPITCLPKTCCTAFEFELSPTLCRCLCPADASGALHTLSVDVSGTCCVWEEATGRCVARGQPLELTDSTCRFIVSTVGGVGWGGGTGGGCLSVRRHTVCRRRLLLTFPGRCLPGRASGRPACTSLRCRWCWRLGLSCGSLTLVPLHCLVKE